MFKEADVDVKSFLIEVIGVVIGLTIILMPLIISSNIIRQKEIELEKYKIEMQYKHGDVVEENK